MSANLPRIPSATELHDQIEEIINKRIGKMGLSLAFKAVLDSAYAGGDVTTLDAGETTASPETIRVLSVFSDCIPTPGEDLIKLPLPGGGHLVLGASRALPAGKRGDGAYLCLPQPHPETAPTDTAWSSANLIRGIRIPIKSSFTAVNIVFEVSANATAGCLAAAGLYSSDGATKILDSGPLDCSTNAVKTGTSLVGWFPRGWYWLVFTCNDTTTQFRTIIDSNTSLTNLINSGTVQRATFGTSSGAVLPASLPSSAGASFATFPFIKLQG